MNGKFGSIAGAELPHGLVSLPLTAFLREFPPPSAKRVNRVSQAWPTADSENMTTDFTDGTDGTLLPRHLPLSVSSVQSVVKFSVLEIWRSHGQSRPVTVITEMNSVHAGAMRSLPAPQGQPLTATLRKIQSDSKRFKVIQTKKKKNLALNSSGARPFYRSAAKRRRTRLLREASCPALMLQSVFGGTPNAACGRHALPSQRQTPLCIGLVDQKCTRNPKNPKNQFSPFLVWKMLLPSLFRTKSGFGSFRIFRKIFGGMGGGMEEMASKKQKAQAQKFPFLRVLPLRGYPAVASFQVWSGSERSHLVKPRPTDPIKFTMEPHPAKYMLKHITMNDLRYNQTSGGAKPVKVCQSVKGQGARDLARSRTLRAICRADSDAAAFLPLTHPGTSLIRAQKIKVAQGCSRWLKVNQGIFKHFFWGKRVENAWAWPGLTANPELLRQGQSNRIGVRRSLTLPGICVNILP